MAQNESTYRYSVDISELKKGITDANRAIREAQSEFKATSSAMEDWENSTEGLQAKLQSLNKIYGIENEKLELIKRQLELTVAEYGESSAAAENMRIKLNNQQAQVNKTAQEYKKYLKRLEEIENANGDTESAVDDMSDALEEANDTAGRTDGYTTAKDVMGNLISDGIEAVTSKVVDMAKELAGAESAYNTFATKTGAIGEEYNEAIENLYKNAYGTDRNEIAEAMAEVKQQTGELDSSKLEKMTENAMLLSDTFGFDVKESMRAVNMLMTQFGVTSDEAFSMIVKGAQNGLDKNGDLLDTINEYSVHYKQMGYDAEEMFNSLVNGSKSGTFSVDKLGDALKEFGVRTKDTAESTTDAFAMLGYGTGASSEDIAECNDEIAELEKKLKYAYMEQENFNDKTSELTKTKNADAIAEYSESLENAKTKLALLTSSTDSSTESVQDLREEFAKGGESAKKATQKVLKKLFEMDNEVARNAAGVGLFGTMWEDLGEDGIKALTNTQGEITKTTDALEEIKEIKYDDIQTEITGLWREIETDFVKPIIEKAIPEIRNGVAWVKENLPTIIPTLSTIAAIIAGMWTVTKIGNFVGALTSLITPAGAVALAIGGVATAIGGIGLAIANTDFKLPDDVQNSIDKIDKLGESYETTRKKINTATSENNSEFQYYFDLWEELKKLVDTNGKVKEGYEDRVDYITNELSKAMGNEEGGEIKIIDGVIQKYKELKESIEDTIKLKQAESMLAAYEESYNEAVKNQGSAQDNYNNILTDIDAYEKQKEERRKALENYKNQLNLLPLGATYQRQHLTEQIAKAQTDINKLNDVLNNGDDALYNKLKEAENTLSGYQSIIENYSNTSAALMDGNVNKVSDALVKLQNNFVTANTGTEQTLQTQVDTLTDKYNTMKATSKVEGAKVNEEELKNLENLINLAKDELDKYRKKTAEKNTEIRTETVKGGKTLSDGFNEGVKSDESKKNIDDATSSFVDKIRDNLDKEKSSLYEKGAELSELVGNGFSAKYKKVQESNKFFPNDFMSGDNRQTPLSNHIVNNYNVNQTNISPEPLSVLEIYRNTKNVFK